MWAWLFDSDRRCYKRNWRGNEGIQRTKREIEDEDASEDEFSTEHDSDGETLNDHSDLEFDFSEADISERSKVEAFIRETRNS